MTKLHYIIPTLMVFLLFMFGNAYAKPVCLYVSSYHQGYHWNDGIETGLKSSLTDACELEYFYMDSKRNKSTDFAKQQAAIAKNMINTIKPDIVIACDDNASKYLVVPYLKNTSTPVIFCGVNWTVEKYGYPYPNVTGIIEVAPIKALILEAQRLIPAAKSIYFISADVVTQYKEVKRIKKIASVQGLELHIHLVSNFVQWQTEFDKTQQGDIVILGNPAGIKDFDKIKAAEFIQNHTKKLTVSFGLAMSRLAVFAMTNIPNEQGEWSGELAKQILAGVSPQDLIITSNRRWKLFVNPKLAKRLNIRIPERLIQNAIIIE